MAYCVIPGRSMKHFQSSMSVMGFLVIFGVRRGRISQLPELPEYVLSNLMTAKTHCTESCQLTFDLSVTSFGRVSFLKHWCT